MSSFYRYDFKCEFLKIGRLVRSRNGDISFINEMLSENGCQFNDKCRYIAVKLPPNLNKQFDCKTISSTDFIHCVFSINKCTTPCT